MEGLIIFVVIVMISSAIGAVSQVLKNQQQNEQERAARARANARAARAAREEDEDDRRNQDVDDDPKKNQSEMERFLQEIDRLRRQHEEQGPPVARPVPVANRVAPETDSVPTVKVARKARPVPPPARAESAPTRRSAIPRLEDLPLAPPAAAPSPLLPNPKPTPKRASKPAKPTKAKGASKPISARGKKATPHQFATQLKTILSSENAMPLAFAMKEILGPPKCKRPGTDVMESWI